MLIHSALLFWALIQVLIPASQTRPQPTQCEDVNWSDIRNACIKGNNYKTYTTSTIDICKEKCVEEEDIKCQSIEYNSAHQLCSISEARSDSDDFIEPCSSDGWELTDIKLNTDACVDISPHCAINAFQCDTNSYVQERCKKTCNLCDSSNCTMPGLECPSPWFRLGSECFLLVKEMEEYRNWTSARTYCGDQAEGADLAQPEDLNALADYMLDNGYATLSWGETSFGCLPGHTDKLFNNTPSFEDCKMACVEERDFICRSADYFPRDQECRLSYQTSASKDFEELCARHHEENLFADILSDVNWSDIRNACIKGNNYKTYTTSTIDICKEKCVEEEDIKCQSIEYNSAHQLCSLSEARSDSDDFIEPCFIDGWEFADIELNTDVCVDISPNCVSDACVDISPNCANNTFQCDTNSYVQERCKKSCNLCDSSKCPMPECQTPWFRLGSECFLLVNEKEEYRNWTSARTYCGNQAEGADLAQPEDLNSLADYMLDNGYATLSWGETSFGCLQGHTHKLLHNTLSFEDCKKACAEERDYVCRSADYFPRDQECRISDKTSASKDYEEPCARHYEENLFADIIFDAGYWLGGSDLATEGEWSWINGNIIDSGWRKDEPSDDDDAEDCLEKRPEYGANSLNDWSCGGKASFVCERH